MKAYSVDVRKREVKEIDIEMQANTVYSFFNSILVDELTTLDKHTMHVDAEAISNNMPAFFIGDQLIVGDALIVGKNGLQEVDAVIPKDELVEIINYDVTPFYEKALNLIGTSDINLYKIFDATKEEDVALNTEWVLYVFNIADDRTKEYFLDELQKVVEAQKDITEYMHKMAILALKASSK